MTAKLTPNDWSLVNKAMKLLKPLYDATLAAENETSCISDIIPLSKKMKIEVQRVNELGVGTLKSELSKEMARYLEGNDIRSHKFPDVELCKATAISTFIDPRYKMDGFKDKDKAERAERIVLSLMGSAVTPTEPEPTNEASQVSTGHSIWDDVLIDPFDYECSDEEVPTRDDTAANSRELDKYLKMPRINVTTDPLTLWRANEMEFPKLAKQARRFLCPPASSSTSEREFKVAKLLVEKRIKLLPSNVEKLLF